MMIDSITERSHRCAWESPTETARYDSSESPYVVFPELIFLTVVTDARNDVIILVAVQHPVDFEKFDLKFLPVALDIGD